jgi:ubiquinone/menaquinone biosynthesis C-methylase UbiE
MTGVTTDGLVIHWAARYDLLAWLFTRGRERAFREQILRLVALAPGLSVLDIGCGTGTLALAAARHVGPAGTVTGIDASSQMIARAAWKASRAKVPVRFQLATAEDLPFPNGKFDVVLSTLMLHHLPKRTREACAREIRRVLKPRGQALVVDFGRPERRGLLSHFHRHGHVTIDEIRAMLARAGLTAISAGPVGFGTLQFVLAEIPHPRDAS